MHAATPGSTSAPPCTTDHSAPSVRKESSPCPPSPSPPPPPLRPGLARIRLSSPLLPVLYSILCCTVYAHTALVFSLCCTVQNLTTTGLYSVQRLGTLQLPYAASACEAPSPSTGLGICLCSVRRLPVTHGPAVAMSPLRLVSRSTAPCLQEHGPVSTSTALCLPQSHSIRVSMSGSRFGLLHIACCTCTYLPRAAHIHICPAIPDRCVPRQPGPPCTYRGRVRPTPGLLYPSAAIPRRSACTHRV
jgi:hypothetical protein